MLLNNVLVNNDCRVDSVYYDQQSSNNATNKINQWKLYK